MEKSRNYVVFGVLALVVSLVAVSLAYAGFTQTLTVSGAASVKGGKWDVHFENVANQTLNTFNTYTGTTNAAWVVQPALVTNSTVLQSYEVVLKTPGDYAEFTFDTVNRGNWNAQLTSITLGSISCTADSYSGSTGSADASDHYYGNLTETENGFTCDDQLRYELYDVTGGSNTLIERTGLGATSSAKAAHVSGTNLAAHGGSKTYKLRLEYVDKNNATKTPKTDVTVTIGDTVFTYQQSGAYVDAPTVTP